MKQRRLSLAILLLALVLPLAAQEVDSGTELPSSPETEGAGRTEQRLDDVVVVAISLERDAEAARFSSALASALLSELTGLGIEARAAPLPAGLEPGRSEPREAARFGREQGAATLALVDAWIEGSRVLWRTAIYDARDGALLGGDAWSAFAGLSSVKLIEDSASQAAADLALARQAGLPALRASEPLRFKSRNDGARVSLGGGGSGASLPLGSIADGVLKAPYLPLRLGERAVFTAQLEGYYDSTFSIKPKDGMKAVRVPRLVPQTDQALVLSTGRGRSYGLGLEYRSFLIPDYIFWRVESALMARATYGLKGAPWSWETRVGSGLYLFFPPSSAFRLAAASGLSAMFTLTPADGAVYSDLILDAADLILEYHVGSLAFSLETRLSYSFGLESGLLRQAWLDNEGPVILAGVQWKW